MNNFIKKIAEETKPDTPVNNSEGRTKGEWITTDFGDDAIIVRSKISHAPICRLNEMQSSSHYPEIRKEAEENAKFICKAVNSHDMLLDALKNLLKSYAADFENITGGKLNDTEAVLKAKEAIKKAEQ